MILHVLSMSDIGENHITGKPVVPEFAGVEDSRVHSADARAAVPGIHWDDVLRVAV